MNRRDVRAISANIAGGDLRRGRGWSEGPVFLNVVRGGNAGRVDVEEGRVSGGGGRQVTDDGVHDNGNGDTGVAADGRQLLPLRFTGFFPKFCG